MASNADGIHTRKDREGWTDAQGRRRWRKLNVGTLQQARKARVGELVRVEQSKVLGFAPPRAEMFADFSAVLEAGCCCEKVINRFCSAQCRAQSFKSFPGGKQGAVHTCANITGSGCPAR